MEQVEAEERGRVGTRGWSREVRMKTLLRDKQRRYRVVSRVAPVM